MTLAGDHRSNREQRPGGCRPRRELGGIDPGLGDVDAVARQGVELQEGPPGPGAGGDDGRGSREDGPFSLPDTTVRRVLTERHVHEDDEPQAPRLRGQHFRRGRSDEPVEQDERPVGDPADGTRKGAERLRVGPRPRSGNFVDVHRPARRGEAASNPAVVGVASARPGRVVDACGDDEMDGVHSARS